MGGDGGPPWPMSPREFFLARVQPVLDAKCLGCHASEPQGGLRMDSREALLKGGQSGPALVSGNPEESLLVQSVRYKHELKMPPTGALPQEEIDALVRWIADGAVWAQQAKPQEDTYTISTEHRQHWSFQPLTDAPVPVPDGARPAQNAIDRFVLAKLTKEELSPSGPADRRTLIRRVTYDLTGLPPTPARSRRLPG